MNSELDLLIRKEDKSKWYYRKKRNSPKGCSSDDVTCHFQVANLMAKAGEAHPYLAHLHYVEVPLAHPHLLAHLCFSLCQLRLPAAVQNQR